MRVGHEEEKRRDRELEFADDGDLLLRHRIDDVRNREADLQVEDLAGQLYPHENQIRDESEDEADEDLADDGDDELGQIERSNRRNGLHDRNAANRPSPRRTSRGTCGAEKTGSMKRITLTRINTRTNVSNFAVVR